MIKNLISRIRARCESLYVGLIFNILLGIAVGVTVYALIQLVSDSYIRLNYASEERRDEREAQEISELQSFVDKNGVEKDDLARIAEWASEKRYLYLMLYDGGRLVYTSDLGVIPADGTIPESSDTVVNSGLTVDHPTNATLRERAIEGERHTVSLGDGRLSAAIYDYSEYMHFDLMNILSMVFAFVALCSIIINYFRRIVKRIRKLEAEVTIVTHSNMEHKVASKGLDELGRLAGNIENMREAILENLKKEREARDSNTELITAMSHDIRTPLTVLLGYLEMMKAEVDELPLLKEYLEASERTALRLKQLSDDMFKYSLAFGNSLDNIVLEPYDAGMLFEQMLAEHVLLLKENGYTTVVNNELFELAPGTVVVTEPQNLMRIFDNVFSNVRKYADIEQPVSITAKHGDGSRIVFECENSIRTDAYKAESNKIGLKTCERLASKIAEKFEYGVSDGKFAARLYMQTKLDLPADEEETPTEEIPRKERVPGIRGALVAFGGFFLSVFKKIKGLLCGKRAEGRTEGRRVSRLVPGIKPIGYAKPEGDAEFCEASAKLGAERGEIIIGAEESANGAATAIDGALEKADDLPNTSKKADDPSDTVEKARAVGFGVSAEGCSSAEMASALPDAVASNKDALGETGFGNEPTRKVADSACAEASAEGNSETEKNDALHISGVAPEGCFGEAVASESGLEGRAAAEGSDSTVTPDGCVNGCSNGIVTPDGCVNGYSDGVLASKGCVGGCSDGFIAPEGCADGGESAEAGLASGGSNEGDGLARGGEGEEPALAREDHAEL